MSEAVAAPTAVAERAFPHCGDAADPDEEPKAAGCGRELRVWVENGKYLTDEPDTNPDLVEIGIYKTRTWLCNESLREHNQKAKG